MLHLVVFVCWLGLTHADGGATHQDDAVIFLQMGLTTARDETLADSKQGMLETKHDATSTDSEQSDGGGHLRRQEICEDSGNANYPCSEYTEVNSCQEGICCEWGKTSAVRRRYLANDAKTNCRRTCGYCATPAPTFTYTISMVMDEGCLNIIKNIADNLVVTKPIGECTTNVDGDHVIFACPHDIGDTGKKIQELEYDNDDCTGEPRLITDINNGCNSYHWGNMRMTWDGWCMGM